MTHHRKEMINEPFDFSRAALIREACNVAREVFPLIHPRIAAPVEAALRIAEAWLPSEPLGQQAAVEGAANTLHEICRELNHSVELSLDAVRGYVTPNWRVPTMWATRAAEAACDAAARNCWEPYIARQLAIAIASAEKASA